MPRHASPRWDIGHGWLRGEDWWGDPMSDNMRLLDALLHPNIISISQSMPPPDALPGDTYVVAEPAAGLWLNQEGKVAIRYTDPDQWRFFVPAPATRARIQDLDGFYWLNDDGEWISEKDGAGGIDPNGKAYDVLCSVGYPPEPGEVLLVFPVPETMTLPKDAPGSLASAMSPPASGTQVGIFRNGGQVARVLFPSNDFTGIITAESQVTLARGDRLTVQMGSAVPGDFGSFGILLRFILPTS